MKVVFLYILWGDIDYATAEAETTYGICGIKVWINKGEILLKDPYAMKENKLIKGVLDNEHAISKKTKYRKQFKGRIHGNSKGNYSLNYGSYGLKALEPERVTSRQIEAARKAITRYLKGLEGCGLEFS